MEKKMRQKDWWEGRKLMITEISDMESSNAIELDIDGYMRANMNWVTEK